MRRFELPTSLSFLHLHTSHTVVFSYLLNAEGMPDTVPSILHAMLTTTPWDIINPFCRWGNGSSQWPSKQRGSRLHPPSHYTNIFSHVTHVHKSLYLCIFPSEKNPTEKNQESLEIIYNLTAAVPGIASILPKVYFCSLNMGVERRLLAIIRIWAMTKVETEGFSREPDSLGIWGGSGLTLEEFLFSVMTLLNISKPIHWAGWTVANTWVGSQF